MAPRLPSPEDVRVDLPSTAGAANRPARAVGSFDASSGLGGVARALGVVADSLDRFVVSGVEEENTAKATEAKLAFEAQAQEFLENPESGYFVSQGEDAFRGRDATLKRLEALRKSIGDRLQGDAKERYDIATTAAYTGLKSSVDGYARKSRSNWLTSTDKAAIETERLRALNSLDNPDARFGALLTADQHVVNIAEREGWSTEELQLERQRVRSDMIAGAVAGLLDRDDAESLRAAIDEFESGRRYIHPDTRSKLVELVREKSETYEAGALVGAALSGGEYAPQFVRRRPTPSPVDYTDADVDLLARTMLGEAAGQGADGMAAVGWVVRNRMDDKRWGSSVGEVAVEGQFSAWNPPIAGGNSNVEISGGPEYERAAQIARAVLDGRVPDPTEGATHYYSPKGMDAYVEQGIQTNREPRWLKEEVARGAPRQIGDHIFIGASQGPHVGKAPAQPYGAGTGTPKPSVMEQELLGESGQKDAAPKLMKAPGPDGGYAATIRWIRSNAPNPRVAKDAIEAYDVELRVRDRARKEEKQQLLDESFAWAEQNAQTGATIRNLPPEVRRNLGGDLEKVEKYLATIRGDSDVETDFAVWQDLRSQFEADPEVFRKSPAEGGIDLREYAGSISMSDRKTMRMWSDSRANGDGASLSTIRSVSQNLLKDAGVKSPSDMAAFEDEIMTRLATRGDVTDQDVFKETQRVLADPAFTQRLQGGPADADGFDLDLTEIQGTLVRTYQLYGVETAVGQLADIEFELMDRLNAYDEEPSDQQIVREARKLLEERGYRPSAQAVKGDDKTPSVSTIRTIAKPVIDAMGIDATKDKPGRMVGRFEQALLRHVTANPGMDQLGIQQRAADMLQEVTINDGYLWDTTVRAFEMTEEQIANENLIIPDDIKGEIEAALQRQGAPVTEENVMRLWRAHLRSLSQ